MISVAVFLLGAVIGSFLNVVITRLPRKEGLLTPGDGLGLYDESLQLSQKPLESMVRQVSYGSTNQPTV
jgi:prepilin signal peptidase PulO-like enzyme (type II secretory pathway)